MYLHVKHEDRVQVNEHSSTMCSPNLEIELQFDEPICEVKRLNGLYLETFTDCEELWKWAYIVPIVGQFYRFHGAFAAASLM